MIWIFSLSLLPMGTHQVHKLYALLCFIAGGSLKWVGWKTLGPYDRPPQATGFSGRVGMPAVLQPAFPDTLRLFASLF